jgi:TRAP-type mannitol/chloroaromatic compound transport system permease large subunit
MTDFDLDRLGDVWRQQPDPAEMERLQKSAADVARRARVTQVTDIVVALVVAGVVIFLVASNPKPGTIALGAAAILVLLFSNIRLRRVRRIELQHLTGGTEEMLDQSVIRMETTLRYRWFTLAAAGPALLIGMMMGAGSGGSNRLVALFPRLGEIMKHRFLLEGMVAAIIVIVGLLTLRSIVRAKRELQRLKSMREAYRRERESSGP